MENSTETALEKTGDNSNESIWKYFKSIFPYLYVLIIILGLVKEVFYYSYFNIGIQNYIGASELFLPVANEVIGLIPFIILFAFYIWYDGIKFGMVEQRKRLIEENVKWWGMFFTEIFIIFISIVTGIILYIIGKGILIYFLIILDLIFFYPLIVYLSIKYFKGYQSKNLNSNILLLPLFIVILIIFLKVGSIAQERLIKDGVYTGTKIYTKDSTYISDSTHFYIGKTTNYYFIFDKDRQSATIIPEREVNRFELKENKISPWLIIDGK